MTQSTTLPPADVLNEQAKEAIQRMAPDNVSALYINGSWVEPADKRYRASFNPANGEVLYQVASGTSADVDLAVAAAQEALQGEWRELSPANRGLLIHRLADLLEANRDEVAALEVLDTGKPLASAQADIDISLGTLRWFAGAPARLVGKAAATDPNHHSYIRREPVGVCGLITAWNFPLNLAVWKMGAALAAGATFVIKPAHVTSLTTTRLVQLTEEAGFPPGVVNLVTGSGREVGDALVTHPQIAKISFTGSTEVGLSIGSKASGLGKRVTLELGGKGANVVFADADLDAAVAGCATAAFANSGQVCCSGSRILVERPVYEAFLGKLKDNVETNVLGQGFETNTTLGPVITTDQFDKVRTYLDYGRDAGIRVITGGDILADSEGNFVEPTVYADVPADDKLAREEIFGPVVTVTPFDSEDEAVALANSTEYGLAAGVWTNDLSRAHRVTANLEAGTVWVNTFLDLDPAMPFGGFKKSGFGRDMGDASVESYTELKSVIIQL